MTVVDDGTIADRRGSLNVDDEGNPTRRNVLIEDGILAGYMQDGLNARLMKANSDRLIDGAIGAAKTSCEALGSRRYARSRGRW